MHTLKTLTLALLLVIFSVTGLRAEEISLEQLIQLNQEGLQARDVADYPIALKKFERGLRNSEKNNHPKPLK